MIKFSEMPYERICYEEYEEGLQQILEEFKGAKSGEEQLGVHKKYYELYHHGNTMQILSEIRHDIDTTDEFYKAEQEYWDETAPLIENLHVRFKKEMYDSPFRSYLEEKIGAVAFRNIEISMKSMQEKIIPLMQEENELTTKYAALIASAEIEWEGDKLNLSLLKPFLTHEDRDIRRKAYEKYTAFFQSVGEQIDEIYDSLVKVRTRQAKELGYDNFVELGYYRVNRNCYDRVMIENFRNQVKQEWVPFVQKVNERRKKRLGLQKLAYIDEDVYFKEGNPKPIGTPEEIMKKGQQLYAELSPETKEFFDFMTTNELFDVLGRKTKKAGGYMNTLEDYKAPFIFANFNGTSGDIDVITHECGHAFQGFLAAKDPIPEHADTTMETAEIHAMSMEFFAEPFLTPMFEEKTENYQELHLEDAALFIPYGCMIDEFQHIVYENPKLTKKERHDAWKKLEQEYKPYLDYEDNTFLGEGRFWQKQQHLFQSPFYYIDYCLAQTCAFQYKIKMDENYKEAWESYLKLCKLSATGFFTDMIQEVGLKSPFTDDYIAEIVKSLSGKMRL